MRMAEGLKYVDSHDAEIRLNQRTGEPYLPGLPSMGEVEVISKVAEWWEATYQEDFAKPGAIRARYQFNPSSNEACDLVCSSADSPADEWEWAIEFKRLQFVGDNGGKNDHHVEKMLSPYLKDRSLMHDIERLTEWRISRKQAVVGYMFSYDFDSCDEALQRHPVEENRVETLRRSCRSNDRDRGTLDPMPLIQIADLQFRSRNLVYPVVTRVVDGLWRHPCGGRVVLFGWELYPKQQRSA